MTVSRTITENPIAEQWRLLSQFTYPPNIRKYLSSRGFSNCKDEDVELIAGSIRQGEAYFKSATNSPLDILPVLLYYGATNLFNGTNVMLTNMQPDIRNHGMVMSDTIASTIAEVEAIPRSANTGALQQFCNIFSPGCVLTNGKAWTMGEILGSIPDLKYDFENHYQNYRSYTIPVEIVHLRQRTLERISNDEFKTFSSPQDAIALMPELSQAYLRPQLTDNYVILHPRRNGQEIGTHSISGRKYLQISHRKNRDLLNPNQLILMYMGLYILSFLPRYRSNLWNPFVRSDTTGERLIIEKFLAICQRYLPNLVLNFIYNKRIQFVNESEGTLDLTSTFTEDQLQHLIETTLQDSNLLEQIAQRIRQKDQT